MWQAKFNDGTVLNEFNADGREILFSEVLKRFDVLDSLSIILEKNNIFTVRMADGRFTVNINGNTNHFFASDVDITKLINIRPIYFVRETVKLAVHAGALSSKGSPAVNFTALGFQANLGERNIKRYLAILPDGSFVIRSE